MAIRNFAQLIEGALARAPKRVAIVGGGQRQTLHAARLARDMGLADCILIDDPDRTKRVSISPACKLSTNGIWSRLRTKPSRWSTPRKQIW
jgi:phosphotransacetylase